MKNNVIESTPAFMTFRPDANGVVYDDTAYAEYPSKFYTFENPDDLAAGEDISSIYGFVSDGVLKVLRGIDQREFEIRAGEYFAFKGPVLIQGNAQGILAERVHEQVLNQIGGPIEKSGRLRYIDGCTDTLLVPPFIKGASCLNYLHFPPGIQQTMHTHPSVRIGLVARGEGLCHTPFGDLPLRTHAPFAILPHDGRTKGDHCFHTAKDSMDVIAYHPDSDFGPEHDNHPMINRTMVGGVSAAKIDGIRTKG